MCADYGNSYQFVRAATDGLWQDAASLEKALRGKIYGADRDEMIRKVLAVSAMELPRPEETRLYLDADEVARLASAGHEIGSHGTSHSSFGLLTLDQARRELEESKRRIMECARKPPRYFSYPYGRKADQIENCPSLLHDAGYSACILAIPRVAASIDIRWDVPRVDIFDEGDPGFSWAVEGYPAYRWIRPWKK